MTLIVIPLVLAVLCFNRSSATSRTISLILKKHALHAAAVDSWILWETYITVGGGGVGCCTVLKLCVRDV